MIRYVVKTDYGYLGHRRFSHKLGSHAHNNRPFENARVFARKQDAEGNCVDAGDHVREVIIKLKVEE